TLITKAKNQTKIRKWVSIDTPSKGQTSTDAETGFPHARPCRVTPAQRPMKRVWQSLRGLGVAVG
ncbi:hypothetical protein, partial [Streptomyces sp. BRA346]|uniref:hypothetical protein n=1 Tax=Streptomyces sp. BRA346 TaxID=2878199 RepID=UPI004063436A